MSYISKQYSQKKTLMAKKCSTSLVIRKMPIKNTLRFHLMPIKLAKMNKTSATLCWWRCGVREEWVCKLVQPLWKSVWCWYLKLQLYCSCQYTQRRTRVCTNTYIFSEANIGFILLIINSWNSTLTIHFHISQTIYKNLWCNK